MWFLGSVFFFFFYSLPAGVFLCPLGPFLSYLSLSYLTFCPHLLSSLFALVLFLSCLYALFLYVLRCWTGNVQKATENLRATNARWIVDEVMEKS